MRVLPRNFNLITNLLIFALAVFMINACGGKRRAQDGSFDFFAPNGPYTVEMYAEALGDSAQIKDLKAGKYEIIQIESFVSNESDRNFAFLVHDIDPNHPDEKNDKVKVSFVSDDEVEKTKSKNSNKSKSNTPNSKPNSKPPKSLSNEFLFPTFLEVGPLEITFTDVLVYKHRTGPSEDIKDWSMKPAPVQDDQILGFAEKLSSSEFGGKTFEHRNQKVWLVAQKNGQIELVFQVDKDQTIVRSNLNQPNDVMVRLTYRPVK